ncbi:MAG: InlB B-repeat-containing protein [Clostridia bacterium]|nr:InlB B-repeat-containing protein [Clostridia bacterium]MBR5410374.1 InlB B-repeat-containing protein [Clostridia bacterium]
MKKLVSALLIVLLLWPAAGLFAGAAPLSSLTVTLSSREQGPADDAFTFAFACDEALRYEEERVLIYAALSRDFTDEEIALTDNAWVLWPVRILAEACRGGVTVSVKTVPIADREISLSLTKDILPALKKGGAYTHESFLYTLQFSVVAETDEALAPLSGEVPFGPYACPETASITYLVPEGTMNPNTAFPYLPYGDLTLLSPSHPGATFGGWRVDGTFTDTVPGNTLELTVEGVFTPRTFKVNYVLTTRQGSFVYANNQENPRSYVFGEETPLYAPVAPQGWVFEGWYESPSLTGRRVTAIAAGRTGDVVLYARWLTEEEYADETAAKAHWGDLDSDGSVTAADARLALRAAVELDELPPLIMKRADFDGKGHLTANDARTLLRVAVGLDSMPEVLRRYGLME